MSMSHKMNKNHPAKPKILKSNAKSSPWSCLMIVMTLTWTSTSSANNKNKTKPHKSPVVHNKPSGSKTLKSSNSWARGHSVRCMLSVRKIPPTCTLLNLLISTRTGALSNSNRSATSTKSSRK